MDDSCSSPDPLNDTIQSPTKSQRSARSHSNHPPSNSPKKKSFHLDVGTHISPQKIYVTVQAEDSDLENVHSRMNEVSPSPHRPHIWHKAVSKTVPLNDISDNDANLEPNTTPKKTKTRCKRTGSSRSGKKRVGTPYKRYKSYSSGDHLNDELFEGEISPLEFGQNNSKTRQNVSQPNAARSKITKRNTPCTKRLKKQIGQVDNLAKNFDTSGNEDSSNKSTLTTRKSFLYASPIQLDSNTESCQGSKPPNKTNLLSVSPLKFKPQLSRKNETNISDTHTLGTIEKNTIMGYRDSLNLDAKSQTNFYPSPSSSENHIGFKPQEVSLQTQQMQPNRQNLQNSNAEDKKCFQEEHEWDSEEEDINRLRDTDTIVESEGFSMISFDSVLSIQGQVSSPKRSRDKNSTLQATKPRKIARHRHEQEDVASVVKKKLLRENYSNDRAYDNRNIRKKNNMENGSSSDRLLRHHDQASLSNYLQGSKSPVEERQHTDGLTLSKVYELSNRNMLDENLEKEPAVLASNSNGLNKDSFPAVPSYIPNASKLTASDLGEKSQLLQIPRRCLSQIAGENTIFPMNQAASHSEKKLSIYDRSSTSDSQLQDLRCQDQTNLNQNHELPCTTAHKSNIPPLHSDDYDISLIQNADIEHNQVPIHITSEKYSSPSLPMCKNQIGNRLLLVPPLTGPSQAITTTKYLQTAPKRTCFSSSPINESNRLGSPFTTPLQEQEPSEISEEILSAGQDNRTGIYPRVDLNSQLSGQLRKSTDSASFIKYTSESDALTRHFPKDKKSQEQVSIKELGRTKTRNRVVSNEAYSSDKYSSYLSWKRQNEVLTSFESNRLDSETRIPREIEEESAINTNNIIADDNDEDLDLLLETLNSSTPSMEENQKLQFKRPEKKETSNQDSANHKELKDKGPIQLDTSNSNELASDFNNSTDRSLRQSCTSIYPTENYSCIDIPPGAKSCFLEKEKPGFDLSSPIKESSIAQYPKLTETSPRSSESPPRERMSPIVEGVDSRALSDKSNKYFESTTQKLGSNLITKTNLNLLNKSSSKTCEDAGRPSMLTATNSYANAEPTPSTCSPLFKPSLHQSENLRLYDAPKLQNLSSLRKKRSSFSSQPAESDEICITHDKIRSPRKHRSGDLPDNSDQVQITRLGSPRSPIKSCIRSPRKVSPGYCSKTKICTPVKVVKFISSSPMRSSPLYDSLSATNWTKNHWLVLEKIVKCWRPEDKNSLFRTENSSTSRDSYRNSTRVISDLLGKHIFSTKCERMKLEQWHLEAVDEFRTQVPGWDEKQVAMRVYALLAGEKARACTN